MSVLASGKCDLCHPANVTIRILRDIDEHIVITLWFGIVGFLVPITLAVLTQRKGFFPHRL